MSDSEQEESVAWPGFVDILSAVIIMFVFFVMITSIIVYMLAQDFKKKVVTTVEQSQYQEMISGMNNIKSMLDPDNLSEETDSEVSKEQLEDVISETIKLLQNLKKEEIEKIQEMVKKNQQSEADTNQGIDEKLKTLQEDNKLLSSKLKELSKDMQLNVGIKQKGSQTIEYDAVARTIKIQFADLAAMYSSEVAEKLEHYISTIHKQLPNTRYNITVLGSAQNMSFTKMKETSFTRAMNTRNALLKQGIDSNNISLSIPRENATKVEGYGSITINIK